MESKTEMTTVVSSTGPSEQVLALSGKKKPKGCDSWKFHDDFIF